MSKGEFDVVLLETRHVKAALSVMAIKTDRRDARGIAQLLRMGWYRPVHRKSVPSQEARALLAARKQMQIKAMDLEQTLDAERAAALPPADRVPWFPADILEWQDLTSRERYLDLKTYALASDRIARAEQRGIAADTLRVAA